MSRETLIGIVLLAAAGFYSRDAWLPSSGSSSIWPPYAAPQAKCETALPRTYDGDSLRFRYPQDWRVSERRDPARGLDQTFVAPASGGGDDVILLFREASATPSAWPGPSGGSGARNAPAPVPAAANGAVPGTQQSFTTDAGGPAYRYLTRAPDGSWDSWMVFLWDAGGTMTAASGPRLRAGWWPPRRTRNEQLNCVFWDVLRTVQSK